MELENLNNQETANSDLGAVSGSALSEFNKEAPKEVFVNDGGLKAVLERENFNCNGTKYSQWNDIAMFEKYYHQWHTGILLFKQHTIDDRRIIEPLGIFDNLKHFSRRLYNELPYDKYISCILFGGERLSISVANTEKWEDKSEFEYSLVAVFIDINQESSNKYHEPI
jgi:hypothetical protein